MQFINVICKYTMQFRVYCISWRNLLYKVIRINRAINIFCVVYYKLYRLLRLLGFFTRIFPSDFLWKLRSFEI